MDADSKIKCPVRINYGPVRINYGPVRKNYGPVRINYGPVHINYGPVRKSYGPVRKNHEMGHFAYKNTYNEAIIDLWPKKIKIYVKIGYSGYDSGKKRFIKNVL